MGGFNLLPNKVALCVFARHWTPGRTKTRLAASIGSEAAAELSREFLTATMASLQGLAADSQICFTPRDKEQAFVALAESQGPQWRAVPQPEGDLGERMRRVLQESVSPTAIVGSDSPDMPNDALREAMQWLGAGGRRFVIGPTDDGGYWTVGCCGEIPPVFDDMPWGTAEVFAITIRRLEAAGWRRGVDYLVLPEWYDVDHFEDLRRLRDRLRSRSDLSPHLFQLLTQVEPHCG